MNAPLILDRRRLLAGSGALIVSFSLANAFAQFQEDFRDDFARASHDVDLFGALQMNHQ